MLQAFETGRFNYTNVLHTLNHKTGSCGQQDFETAVKISSYLSSSHLLYNSEVIYSGIIYKKD